jgi:peptide/nickel transport system permease protein
MNIGAFILRRLLLQIFVLFGLSVFTFLLMFGLPGDPAAILYSAGGSLGFEEYEHFRQKWGLDLPIWKQYANFVTNLLKGDMGTSLVTRAPIFDQLKSYFPATIELSVVAFIFALIMGLPLGVISALRRNTWIDHTIRGISLFGVSMPIFWLAIILLIIFYYHLGIVPSSQRIDLDMEIPRHITGFYLIDTLVDGNWRGFINSLHHLVLPAFVLGFSVVGLLARVTRASILEVISLDYVRTARSKGLHEKTVIFRHVIRNALIPTVTLLGLLVGGLLSGAVLTETIFAWPGVGRFAVQSIMLLDRLAVVDVTILVGIVVSTANLTVDILVAFLDPRIRY